MSKKGRSNRRKINRASASQHAINTVTNPDAAGIDVGAEELVAAVAPGRDPQTVVRTFTSFTAGVEALRDWLVACGVKTVAIESTGNYWITAYDILEQAGLDVFLVNARHVKGVPGKKTDVCDAQWLQQLHAAGLLKKSFRPAQEIVPLRYLMRHRQELVGDCSRQIQLMQKVLTEMNLKIQHVFSDLDGTSAQAIITAILAGERDVEKLAALRDRRCRTPHATIVAALRGNYREEYLFVLRQSQNAWRQLRQTIAECDEQIARLASKVSGACDTPMPPRPTGELQLSKNGPQMNICGEAWRFYGVDLTLIPGVNVGVLSVLMSEIGTRSQLLEKFRSAQAFCSWMALCPDNRVSGGKVLKAKTRKVPSRLARALRLAAFGLGRAKSAMGDYCRRMKGRLGKAEGIVAVAHKLARLIYALIHSQTQYDEAEAFKLTPANLQRRRKKLERQAADLGFQLIPSP